MQANLEKIVSLIASRDSANIEIALEILKNNPDLRQQTQSYYNGIIDFVGGNDINDIEWVLNLLEGDASQNEKGEWVEFRPYEHYMHEAWKKIANAINSPLFITLESVRLYKVEITPVLLEAIITLPKLKTLEIYNCNLKAFPREILSIKSLTKLNLSNNDISEIPEEISMLSHLNELNLSKNNISSVPTIINSLDKLESINLANNQIAHLQLPYGLKRIELCNNKINKIPDSIYDMQELAYLDISNNEVISINNNISKLPLYALYLHNNKILPNRVKELKELMPNCFGFDSKK